MNITLEQPKQNTQFEQVLVYTYKELHRLGKNTEYASGSINVTILKDVIANTQPTTLVTKRTKLSELKGKVKQVTSKEIDEKLNDLRSEWERNI